MARIQGWSVCLVLAAASCGRLASAGALFRDYLQLPDAASLETEAFHLNVSEAVAELNLGSGLGPEMILGRIKERLAEENLDVSRRKIYERFVSVANANERPVFCSNELVQLSKSILGQWKARHSKSILDFYIFFRPLARRKFENCTKSISSRLDLLPGFRVENSLDHFFTYAVDEFKSPNRFVYRLHETTLDSDRFNATGVLRFIDRMRSRKAHAKHQPMTLLKNFLDRNCELLFAYLGRTLDVINLALALNSHVLIPLRLQKLNEYNRLCSVWRRPDKRQQVAKIIQSQLVRR